MRLPLASCGASLLSPAAELPLRSMTLRLRNVPASIARSLRASLCGPAVIGSLQAGQVVALRHFTALASVVAVCVRMSQQAAAMDRSDLHCRRSLIDLCRCHRVRLDQR